jgi:hypothetical protein
MWFPGCGFQRKANEWSQTLCEMVERPFSFVKQQIVSLGNTLFALFIAQNIGKASGTAEVSFSSSFLQRKELSAEEEFDLKWSAASLYSGVFPLYSYLSSIHNGSITGAADTVCGVWLSMSSASPFDKSCRQYPPFIRSSWPFLYTLT